MVALDWPVNMTDAKYPQPHLKQWNILYPSISVHLYMLNFTISIFTRIIVGTNFQSQHILLHQYIIKEYLH
jgi:hypothetical protein